MQVSHWLTTFPGNKNKNVTWSIHRSTERKHNNNRFLHGSGSLGNVPGRGTNIYLCWQKRIILSIKDLGSLIGLAFMTHCEMVVDTQGSWISEIKLNKEWNDYIDEQRDILLIHMPATIFVF